MTYFIPKTLSPQGLWFSKQQLNMMQIFRVYQAAAKKQPFFYLSIA
jgi:hypothetical protein